LVVSASLPFEHAIIRCVETHVQRPRYILFESFLVLVCMVVGIQTNTPFVCVWGGGGAHRTRVCGYMHMQYDTHTNWRTEEERTDRGGA